MNSTASPRLSAALGQATKFIRVLENSGVTDADIQRVINDPDFRRKIVEAFGYVAEFVSFDLPGDFQQEGIGRLVNRMYDKFIQNVKPPIGPKPGPEKYLERYKSTDAVKQLLADLTPLQLQLVMLTFGLVDGITLAEPEVAQRLKITARRVRYNLGSALYLMWRKNHEIEVAEQRLLDKAAEPATFGQLLPESPIEDLGLNRKAYQSLERADIHVVADLIGLSAEDLRDRFNLDENMLDEVETRLEAHSLKLKS